MKVAQKLVIGYYRTKLRLLSAMSKKWAARSAFDLFCTPLRRPARKMPAIFNDAEQLHFTFKEYTVRGYRFNHPSDKKALVIHGFESSARNFDRYITLLVKQGYEVMAFDAPAHGNSSGSRINLPLYVETLRKINEKYGPICRFVAHSFGGLALAHFLEEMQADASVKAALIAPATETTSSINIFFSFLRIGDTVKNEFNKLIRELSGFGPEHFSVRRAIKNVYAGIVWYHDEDDELTPLSDALKVKGDGHPNIEFRITKGLGHRKIYRDHQVQKEIIEFLS